MCYNVLHIINVQKMNAWHNPLVPIIYILNFLVLGSIIIFTVLFHYNTKINLLSNFIIIISMTAFFFKLLYWYSIKKTAKRNLSAVRASDNQNNVKIYLLRLAFCIFTYITPTYYIAQQPSLVMSNHVVSITLVIITIVAIIGMFIERYLFFIE